MTPAGGREAAVDALLAMSREALGVAEREAALSPAPAVNRAYYAAFYAASAVFTAEGRGFSKHTALRAAVHRDLVKTGRLDAETAALFDQLLEDRTDADYGTFTALTPQDGREAFETASRVAAALTALLPPESGPAGPSPDGRDGGGHIPSTGPRTGREHRRGVRTEVALARGNLALARGNLTLARGNPGAA